MTGILMLFSTNQLDVQINYIHIFLITNEVYSFYTNQSLRDNFFIKMW